jgi:hypothetical protein
VGQKEREPSSLFSISFLFSIFLTSYYVNLKWYEFKFKCNFEIKYHHMFNKQANTQAHKVSHIKMFYHVNLSYKYYLFWLYILVPMQSFKKFKFLVIFELGQILGCYKPTPLKRISSSRFKLILEEIEKFLFKIVLSFPCGFYLCMITPLYSAESYYYPPGLSGDHIQYFNWSFLILQIWL